MEAEEQEIPTNLQEGTSKGRGERTDNRHKDIPIWDRKHSVKQIEPDTGQQNEMFNNKSWSRLSKKKTCHIKKKQQQQSGAKKGKETTEHDDFKAINSEDE